MNDLKFSGEDQILFFDYLSRLVKEAEALYMNGGQLMVCTPHMLTKTAAHEYLSSSSENRIQRLPYWAEISNISFARTTLTPPLAKQPITSKNPSKLE